MVKQISEAEFEPKVLGVSGLVLVDFFATWCGPCKMMTPILDEVSKAVGFEVPIYKVDVDECRVLASRYNIMGVPTLYLFKDGEIVREFVGVQPSDIIIQEIQAAQ